MDRSPQEKIAQRPPCSFHLSSSLKIVAALPLLGSTINSATQLLAAFPVDLPVAVVSVALCNRKKKEKKNRAASPFPCCFSCFPAFLLYSWHGSNLFVRCMPFRWTASCRVCSKIIGRKHCAASSLFLSLEQLFKAGGYPSPSSFCHP